MAPGRVNGALMMKFKKGLLEKKSSPPSIHTRFCQKDNRHDSSIFFSAAPIIVRQDEKINRALGNQFFIYEKLLPVVHT